MMPPDDGLVVPAGFVDSLFDVRGRMAVVTGAGSGLGAAISIGYAQAGVTVVLADLNDEAAGATATTIAEQGGLAHVRHLDVTSKAEVDALAEAVIDEFGRVDILVNS